MENVADEIKKFKWMEVEMKKEILERE